MDINDKMVCSIIKAINSAEDGAVGTFIEDFANEIGSKPPIYKKTGYSFVFRVNKYFEQNCIPLKASYGTLVNRKKDESHRSIIFRYNADNLDICNIKQLKKFINCKL